MALIDFLLPGVSMLGGLLGSHSQDKTNKANIAMQRETNQMQLQAMREQNAFNKQMALEQWQRETEYNDPSQQVKRMVAAGLNPWSSADGASFTTGNNNAAAPTASGLPSLSAPHGEVIQSGVEKGFAAFSQIAAAFAGLGQAKKAGVETTQLEKAMNEYVRGLQLDNEAKDIANSINAAFGMQERTAQVAKLHQEVLKTIEDVSLAKKQNDGVALDNALKHIEKLMQDKRLEYLPRTLEQQLRNLKATEADIHASVESKRAAAKSSLASASLAQAQEAALSQPFQGLTLSDEQKQALTTVMYEASLEDEHARKLLAEINSQEHRWSKDSISELLRWMKGKVNDSPVLGNIIKALEAL